ncbi:MAG TPA: hypothetical protein VIL36_04110 [Acidimicrobiales bacterium]
MALALRVVGVADDVEFLATLLVVPVIGATLLVDRNLGYVVAGVAAVAYLYLRFDDIQDAGAVGVVVLVLFRAASYGGVAHMTPLLFARLSGEPEVDIGVPARHLRAEPVPVEPVAAGARAGWGDSGDRWAAEPTVATALADDAYAPESLADTYAEADVYDDAYADASVGAVDAPTSPWADEPPLDAWSPDVDGPAGVPPLERLDEPPAPRVPTGWIDDATSPLGDETIPVGYTGELFLGRITGSVPAVPPGPGVPSNGSRNGSGAGPGGVGDGVGVAPPAVGGVGGVGGNGTARPGYADTEPLRPLAPAGPVDLGLTAGRGAGTGSGSGTDWSSRVGGGAGGRGDRGRGPVSGEQPAPWTVRSDDAWDTTPARGGPAASPTTPTTPPSPTSRVSPPGGERGWSDPWPSGGTPAVRPGGERGWGDPRPSGRTPAVGPGGPGGSVGAGGWGDPRPSGATPAVGFPPAAPSHGRGAPEPPAPAPPPTPAGGVDPETRLWNAPFFRDRLNAAIARSQAAAAPFSVVMIQVPDEPFQPLPYRRQVALLRELGHQFVPRFVDHLVHLPDGEQHWFAVVLDDTDRTAAHSFERRLRTTLAGYLRSRGLRVGELQSASLTSPDDDEAMATIWASLLGADNVGA